MFKLVILNAMGVFIYIHNTYTQYTHMQTKLLFWMQLITINCLTALFFLYIYISNVTVIIFNYNVTKHFGVK